MPTVVQAQDYDYIVKIAGFEYWIQLLFNFMWV